MFLNIYKRFEEVIKFDSHNEDQNINLGLNERVLSLKKVIFTHNLAAFQF